MGKWGTSGWGEANEAAEEQAERSARSGPKRLWMEPESTKRIMFLDDDPFGFHQHNLFEITKKSNKEICLEKAGAGECPLCDAGMYPSFVGCFAVIDMGEVDVEEGEDGKPQAVLYGFEDDKGVVHQFLRRILMASAGSKDKPGMLKKWGRISAKKGGNLAGTVWDVYRSGKLVEACGDEPEFVEMVAREDWETYLVDAGATAKELNLSPLNGVDEFELPDPERLARLVKGHAARGSSGAKGRRSKGRKAKAGSTDGPGF